MKVNKRIFTKHIAEDSSGRFEEKLQDAIQSIQENSKIIDIKYNANVAKSATQHSTYTSFLFAALIIYEKSN